MSTLYQQLPLLPLAFGRLIPKPSPHPDRPNCIIITTLSDFSKPGIYEYNLITNQLDFLHKYENCVVDHHGQYIDPKTKLLYIVGRAFVSFDLKTNKMISDGEHRLASVDFYPRIAYVPPPINQTHICQTYDEPWHVIHDLNTQNITERILSTDFGEFGCPKLMYVPFAKKLMIFGSDCQSAMWECDINDNGNQDTYEWKLIGLEMPHACDDDREYNVILAFEYILFAFYFGESGYSDIFCLDLLNNEWEDTGHKTPQSIAYAWSIKTDNNDVHILDMGKGNHFMVSLHDLIPRKLIKSHRKYYASQIMGYVREQEKNYKINIPFVLKMLIRNYFPLFV